MKDITCILHDLIQDGGAKKRDMYLRVAVVTWRRIWDRVRLNRDPSSRERLSRCHFSFEVDVASFVVYGTGSGRQRSSFFRYKISVAPQTALQASFLQFLPVWHGFSFLKFEWHLRFRWNGSFLWTNKWFILFSCSFFPFFYCYMI